MCARRPSQPMISHLKPLPPLPMYLSLALDSFFCRPRPHTQRLTPIPQESCGSRRRVLSNLCPRCHPFYNSKPHPICGTFFQETSALISHCIAFCCIKLADLRLNVLTRVVAARASEEAMTELAGKSSLQAVVDAAFAASAAHHAAAKGLCTPLDPSISPHKSLSFSFLPRHSPPNRVLIAPHPSLHHHCCSSPFHPGRLPPCLLSLPTAGPLCCS